MSITTSTAPAAQRESSASHGVARRERWFAAIRLARSLSEDPADGAGAVVDFPTTVVVDGQPFDLHSTARPGWFPEGHHSITVHGTVAGYDVSGRFEVCVGPSFGVSPASWQARELATDLYVDLPDEVRSQLPRSTELPLQGFVGAVRRATLAAERARAELLTANRGLVVTVVKRFRGVARNERAIIEQGDLVAVGEQTLLEVVDRWFTDPDRPPLRDVAFSKLVQRAVGNALRSEIARATGISVEFRQLLSWFHTHPDDRFQPATEVAYRMAFEAGVTRVMSAHGLRTRAQAADLLHGMLERGEAVYVAPGREASARSRALRAEGTLVISSRSSLAEIERAARFGGASVALDADDERTNTEAFLGVHDRGLDDAEAVDAVRSLILESGLTEVEAAVWVLRTGVLDPTGSTTELPDIATELSLSGRAEARAALRRARRKVEQWANTVAETADPVLEPVAAMPTRITPGTDVRNDITRR